MRSILQQVILENTVQRYLIFIGILLLMLIFKRYLSRYLAGLLFRWIKKIAGSVEKSTFINLVATPLQHFLLIVITVLALLELKYPKKPVYIWGEAFEPDFVIYKTTFHAVLETITIIVLIYSFISLLLRIIDFIAIIMEEKASTTDDQSDNQLVVFFKDFFKVLIFIVGVLMVLKFGFHYNIGSLLTGLSIAGAAIALSTRESLENLIASFIIFFDKPFTVGDLVKVQQITGNVEKIGLRSTRIRTDQHSYVTVPNKQMVDSILDNLTLRTHRRIFVELAIAAHSNHEVIHQLVQEIQALIDSKKPVIASGQAFLADIQQHALIVQIECFTEHIPIPAFNMFRQELNLSVMKLVHEKGLTLVARGIEGFVVS